MKKSMSAKLEGKTVKLVCLLPRQHSFLPGGWPPMVSIGETGQPLREVCLTPHLLGVLSRWWEDGRPITETDLSLFMKATEPVRVKVLIGQPEKGLWCRLACQGVDVSAPFPIESGLAQWELSRSMLGRAVSAHVFTESAEGYRQPVSVSAMAQVADGEILLTADIPATWGW